MRHVSQITPIAQLMSASATRLHASAVLAGVEAGATPAVRRQEDEGAASANCGRPASKSVDSVSPFAPAPSHRAAGDRAACPSPDPAPTLPAGGGRVAHLLGHALNRTLSVDYEVVNARGTALLTTNDPDIARREARRLSRLHDGVRVEAVTLTQTRTRFFRPRLTAAVVEVRA